MDTTLLILGVMCIVAAIVGGGIQAAGFKFPVISSLPRQALLLIVGIGLIVYSRTISSPPPPPTPGPAMPATQVFDEPIFDGYRLDWCYAPASDCGIRAATEWCKTQGFAGAIDFADDPDVGKKGIQTKNLKTGTICASPICDSFKRITCTK